MTYNALQCLVFGGAGHFPPSQSHERPVRPLQKPIIDPREPTPFHRAVPRTEVHSVHAVVSSRRATPSFLDGWWPGRLHLTVRDFYADTVEKLGHDGCPFVLPMRRWALQHGLTRRFKLRGALGPSRSIHCLPRRNSAQSRWSLPHHSERSGSHGPGYRGSWCGVMRERTTPHRGWAAFSSRVAAGRHDRPNPAKPCGLGSMYQYQPGTLSRRHDRLRY